MRIFAILILFIVPVTICCTAERRYSIISDQVKGFKAYEYSINDATGNILQYRIESNFAFLQSLEVFSYPSKKLVGKLRAKSRFRKNYEANIEVYDNRYKGWVKGVISEIHSREDKWKIQYYNHSLSVAHKDKGTTYFIDESCNNIVLAQYDWKAAGVFESMVRYRTFHLHVYSNEIPHIVYFLYIAAVDRNFYQRG